MKRLLKLAIGLLIAYVVYRLLAEYLQPTRVSLEERPGTVPLHREPPPPTSTPEPKFSPPPATEPDRVNLNQANAEALITLPGIGPRLAERIIAYRQEAGSFASLDELSMVQGIGPALVEQLRSLVTSS
jgi:competence ComEA-like helix-hairpin-helix protein